MRRGEFVRRARERYDRRAPGQGGGFLDAFLDDTASSVVLVSDVISNGTILAGVLRSSSRTTCPSPDPDPRSCGGHDPRRASAPLIPVLAL